MAKPKANRKLRSVNSRQSRSSKAALRVSASIAVETPVELISEDLFLEGMRICTIIPQGGIPFLREKFSLREGPLDWRNPPGPGKVSRPVLSKDRPAYNCGVVGS